MKFSDELLVLNRVCADLNVINLKYLLSAADAFKFSEDINRQNLKSVPILQEQKQLQESVV